MSCHVLTKHLAQMEFKAISRKISPHCDCVRTMIEGQSSLYSADGSSSKFNSSPFFLQLTGSHRAPHIMALNVTQMRIAHLFSLTMMDG